jgi:diaminohydroxyphosphoribosylaminopyrimidine deaminase/5-amino-6-(5-phosphoribosylamino)uracil reductase
VEQQDRGLISQSVLYVSLEPCAHQGKTPPCTDLIIQQKIPKVVIGCRDPFVSVDGKGIAVLKRAGVDVQEGVLLGQCTKLNRRFMTFHGKRRPFIILKWAQSADAKMASPSRQRLAISNVYTNRIVHQWRSQESSILIGTNTAFLDDPQLTTRLWPGINPARLVIDLQLQLPQTLRIFDGQAKTVIFNRIKQEEQDNLLYYQVAQDQSLVPQILFALWELQLTSVIIEGGPRVLQSFIDESPWDEARIITNEDLLISDGLAAPILPPVKRLWREQIFSDSICCYEKN